MILGLSPRGRGKPGRCPQSACPSRSIPAWAGETSHRRRPSVEPPVYPRVGGGNLHAVRQGALDGGLSPRGRGKPYALTDAERGRRSIPAWAGETRKSTGICGGKGVYPRVGGGNPSRRRPKPIVFGLSPRGRGKLCQIDGRNLVKRSIPAWAGETGWGRIGNTTLSVYPRVGGGNTSSPVSSSISRSIPAWAGETTKPSFAITPDKVYPRVGGGNVGGFIASRVLIGLSPRGRGKPGADEGAGGKQGSIPAWAGETSLD